LLNKLLYKINNFIETTMILNSYEKTVESLSKFLEDNIQWGRTNEIFMGFATEEMLEADDGLMYDLAECFLAKKDVIRIEKHLLSLVKELEGGNDSEEFYSGLEEMFFNPFTCKPVSVIYSDWGHLIEQCIKYDKIKKDAMAEVNGICVEFSENILFSIELENEIYSYLEKIDNVFNMILQKIDRIDILIYLKNNIL